MSDEKDTPKIFANRMIRMIVDHSFGDDMDIPADEYMVIRVAFRKMGGEWEEIFLGNHEHVNKLKQVVSMWGQQRQNKSGQPELV